MDPDVLLLCLAICVMYYVDLLSPPLSTHIHSQDRTEAGAPLQLQFHKVVAVPSWRCLPSHLCQAVAVCTCRTALKVALHALHSPALVEGTCPGHNFTTHICASFLCLHTQDCAEAGAPLQLHLCQAVAAGRQAGGACTCALPNLQLSSYSSTSNCYYTPASLQDRTEAGAPLQLHFCQAVAAGRQAGACAPAVASRLLRLCCTTAGPR